MSKSPTPKERLIAELLPLTHRGPWEVARKHKERARRYRHWAVEADGAGFTAEAETFHRFADRYVQLFLGFLNEKASALWDMMLSDPRMPPNSRFLEADFDPEHAANLAIRAVQLLTSEQAAASEAASVARQADEAIAKRLLGVIAENAADDILQKAGAIISSDATVAESPSAPEALWKRSGTLWRVRAFGEEGDFPDLIGFRYIAKLLSKPNKPVPMRDILAPGDTPREVAIDEAMSDREPPPQAVMDDQALKELYTEIKNTKAALERARQDHNVTECDLLESELHRLQSQVRAATRPGGVPRNFSRGRDKTRASILNALRRVYRHLIDGGLSETARHLEISIRTTGPDCVYQPARPVHWKVVTPDVT